MGIQNGDGRFKAAAAAGTGIIVASSLYFTGGGKQFVFGFRKGLRSIFVPGDDDIDPDGTGFGGGSGSGAEAGGFDAAEFSIDVVIGFMVASLMYAAMNRSSSQSA
jgi:hypothetical protein